MTRLTCMYYMCVIECKHKVSRQNENFDKISFCELHSIVKERLCVCEYVHIT